MKDIICNAHYAPTYSYDLIYDINNKDAASARSWTIAGKRKYWAAARATDRMLETSRYIREIKRGRTVAQEKMTVRIQALAAKIQDLVGRVFKELLGAYLDLALAASAWGVEADDLSKLLGTEVESVTGAWRLGFEQAGVVIESGEEDEVEGLKDWSGQ